jgi:RHS repeat-associated protein
MRTRRNVRSWLATLAVTIMLLPAWILAQTTGEDNPTGPSGIYNGNVLDAGNFDPHTYNALRTVTDIEVPGSVGAYPLKWTRYFNNRNLVGLGPSVGWTFSYFYGLGNYGPTESFPDGRWLNFAANCPLAVEEGLGTFTAANGIQYYGIVLADGGGVAFNSYPQPFGNPYNLPVALIDPYGQVTTISYVVAGYCGGYPIYNLDRVTEPGGRYLQLYWTSSVLCGSLTTPPLITRVEANDGRGNVTQWVNYTWTQWTAPGTNRTFTVLSQVAYSDGNSATYTYTMSAGAAVLSTANDVRYNGAMRQMKYVWKTTAAVPPNPSSTLLVSENNSSTGEAVATLTTNSSGQRVETRGDGATRTFAYGAGLGGGGNCHPTSGKLTSYTDFLGHTTNITYEDGGANGPDDPHYGFIKTVTDPNGHTTTYTRQANGGWGITQITHPDGSTIQQTFWQDLPYYLASRTDELGHTTVYTRDANFRITRKDYPDGGFETFAYNNFGEVVTHEMTSGGTETFGYDNRGLKTSYIDATSGETDYLYYPSGPWTDRLQTVIHPPNASGFRASETYEYDRDGNGNPVAGRGLVTKITYADGNFVTKTYNQYGDLLTSTDELGHTTTYTYDNYGRVLTTKDPLGNVTTNDYHVPGKSGSSYITTSKLPFVTTLPSGKKTNFYYDPNWRKTRVQVAPGTSDEADTYFTYDQGTRPADGNTNIGLLTSTTDPRGNVTSYTYDIRDRQISITDALNHTTSFVFDAHGNKISETHASGELITYDQYDPMNRLLQKSVHRDATTVDVTHMTYDSAGNLTTQKDENGNLYSYSYDKMNRPLKMTYPNNLFEVHSYDAAGNVQTYTNRSGAVQTFSYDNRNRQTHFSWSDGTSPQTTAYDAASRKTEIDNNDATITLGYDYDNRLTTQTEREITANVGDNVARTVTYTYDVDGNRSTIQYPSGSKFDYAYTQRNQVASIKLDGQVNPIVSYIFDPSGNITSRSLDNGTSTAYTVDAVDKDTSIVATLAGSVTKRFDYAYNSVNDILAVQRDSAGGDGFTYDLTEQIIGFQHDGTSVNLSTGAVTGGTPNTMKFDGCGNRTNLNGASESFNNMNQPTDVPHDNDGNVQSYNGFIYSYDAQNRLRSVTSASSTINFYYDGLNRQVARVSGSGGTPTPTPTPTATPTPTPRPTPTPSATLTPSPTPTPNPNQCAPVSFTKGQNLQSGDYTVSMSTTTQGATIFYTTDGTTPTHNGSTATGTTQTYTGPVDIGKCGDHPFSALAYKSGYSDSSVTSQDYNLGACGPMLMTMASSSQTIIFSVWDGDWAILEEYNSTGARVQGYVQGYHGLVKTLVDNIYYYQDELGSTSHVASASGVLLEYYKYNLYGAPTYWNASGQITASACNVQDLGNGGARWIPQLGLYDDRNRFMSPALGRFLQPDPIGFKGDASNLYRYCSNDWANRTDPTGLDGPPIEKPDGGSTTGHDFESRLSGWEKQTQVSVDAHSVEMHQEAAREAHEAAREAQQRSEGLSMGQVGVERNVQIGVGKPDKNGLVTYDKQSYDGSVAAAKAAHDATMEDGIERHYSGVVDTRTNKFSVLGPNKGIGIPWTGPQIGRGPNPGQNQLLVTSIHSHSNDRSMGSEDFAKGNTNHIPVFVGLMNGRVQVYVPRFNARPTSTAQGIVFYGN